jgi:hypothetical protein
MQELPKAAIFYTSTCRFAAMYSNICFSTRG